MHLERQREDGNPDSVQRGEHQVGVGESRVGVVGTCERSRVGETSFHRLLLQNLEAPVNPESKNRNIQVVSRLLSAYTAVVSSGDEYRYLWDQPRANFSTFALRRLR